MEKNNFLEKLGKLVELAKGKHNALDVTEINNFFTALKEIQALLPIPS